MFPNWAELLVRPCNFSECLVIVGNGRNVGLLPLYFGAMFSCPGADIAINKPGDDAYQDADMASIHPTYSFWGVSCVVYS